MAAHGKGMYFFSFYCKSNVLHITNVRHYWRPLGSPYYIKRLWRSIKDGPLAATEIFNHYNVTNKTDHHVVTSTKKNIVNKKLSVKFNLPLAKSIASYDNGKNVEFEKENIWTIPNLLTISRITMSPFIGYFIVTQHHYGAMGLFLIASLTDLLDGLIARHFPSQSSRVGSILDPLADKFLVSILYVSLTFVHLIPLPLTLLIISRDSFLVCASFYLRYLTLPPPKTWRRYWDVQRSGVQITPNVLGKINTLLQLTLIGTTMAAPVFHYINHPVLQSLWYIIGCTTVLSGLSYCVQMKGFQVIKKSKQNTS